MRRSRENMAAEREASDAVRSIYAELEDRPAERDCQFRAGCCQFRLTGKTPHLTAGEALVAARALQATGRKSLPQRDDGACPLLHLQTSRCLIYHARPFGCRTHFCAAAGGPFARRDVADLIRRLEAVGESLGAREARPIEPAISAFL